MDDKHSSSADHETGWAEGEERTFPVSAPAVYKYYKLKITGRNGNKDATFVGIKELSLVGKYPVGPIQKWMDKSGNGNHATQATPSRMPTYSISDSLLNNKPSISSTSHNGKIGFDLPSISLQEIFVVAYYKDGSDTTFDNYNTLISGPDLKEHTAYLVTKIRTICFIRALTL